MLHRAASIVALALLLPAAAHAQQPPKDVTVAYSLLNDAATCLRIGCTRDRSDLLFYAINSAVTQEIERDRLKADAPKPAP